VFFVDTEENTSSTFHGSHGIEISFDKENLTTGNGSILEIEGSTTPANTLAQQASCTPPGGSAWCTSAPA
jgi:hypothetical protein